MGPSKLANIGAIVNSVQMIANRTEPQNGYRFDIFKGTVGPDGKITRVRSVGSAYLRDGMKTYVVALKTFLEDRFYLLPNTKSENEAEFVILTREAAQHINRKYFWNSIGDGKILEGTNAGLLKLNWDVLSDDIYMSLHPIKISEIPKEEIAA